MWAMHLEQGLAGGKRAVNANSFGSCKGPEDGPQPGPTPHWLIALI